MKNRNLLTAVLLGLSLILAFGPAACDGDGGSSGHDNGEEEDPSGGPYYDPTWAVSTDVLSPVRGFRIIRGIIHAHSIYSHDACDNRPLCNPECLEEFRDALCTTRQDYIMLTDHDEHFAEYEFPEVLLYMPEEGDELLFDELDRPMANRIFCEDGSFSTLMAGTENDLMPIHLHRHPDGTVEDRYRLYGRRDPAAADEMRALGASVFVNHDEDWSIEELIALAPDGIEIFNLHAAIAPDLRPVLGVGPLDFIPDLLYFLSDPALPHPNLTMMTFWPCTNAWNVRWDALLGVQRCVGIAGTDVHRNALPFPLSDGERADGYRRMMQFFSNHILVDDEEPASIEEALDRGRLYAAFEYLGMPEGFDFYAVNGTDTYEMGDEAPLVEGLSIRVTRPNAFQLDPVGPQPEIRLRLIRVLVSGSSVVAEGEWDIDYTVDEPGAYRAEVHIVPWHLEPFLGSDPARFIQSYPWIYGNPIYVRDIPK